jgi:glycosyltransferase involved in cell wall biosynthesis
MIYIAFTNFSTFGGAEIISINITKGIAEKGIDVSLLSSSSKKDYNKKYDINNFIIEKLSLLLILRLKNDSTVISHHRKVTSIILLLKTIFRKKFQVIHVAHNEFFSLKRFTLFPDSIVAVSQKVKQNLIDYFNVDAKRVKVIYNGIPDRNPEMKIEIRKNSGSIKILIPARVNKVKQQILIVETLTNKLNKNIEIHFAGEGDDLDRLKKITNGKSQFKILGFQSFDEIINDYDYVMLFSKVEGLPTVFLEAFMYGKPIISNNAGGSLEMLDDSVNGFYASDFKCLINVINALPANYSEEYRQLCFNARKKYEENYTLDKMINSYLNLIKK